MKIPSDVVLLRGHVNFHGAHVFAIEHSRHILGNATFVTICYMCLDCFGRRRVHQQMHRDYCGKQCQELYFGIEIGLN